MAGIEQGVDMFLLAANQSDGITVIEVGFMPTFTVGALVASQHHHYGIAAPGQLHRCSDVAGILVRMGQGGGVGKPIAALAGDRAALGVGHSVSY